MERRTLAQGRLEIARLGFGAMTLGAQTDEKTAARMVDLCFDSGASFFDTANVYSQGQSEEMLGRLLNGRRGRAVLATKARGRMEGPPPYEGLAPGALRRAVEESLRRLRTDYVDILYLHQPDYAVAPEDTLETLEALRQEGKIRRSGVSNYASWQTCEMIYACRSRDWEPPAISQQMYNVITRGLEQEYVPFAERYGVGLAIYNPLAGGLLTGKQSWQAGPLAGTRFDANERYLKRYWHPQLFEAIEQLRALAETAGRSLLELSLRWLLDRPFVDCVIVGASKFEHLEANLRAASSAPLSEEIHAACDEIWSRLKGPVAQYNR